MDRAQSSPPPPAAVDPRRYPMGRAVLEAYARGEEDETLEPLALVDAAGSPAGRIRRGDAAVFYDIRGEREVELTQSLTEPGFDRFPVEPLDLDFVTMIRYGDGLRARAAFPPLDELADTLAARVSRAGLRQLKVCESEKEVHVSFFFNGKRRGFLPGEEVWSVESPRDAGDYAGFPKMSAAGVADAAIEALASRAYGFILVNFANVDVLGHTSNPNAVILAVQTVDRELGRVLEAARRADMTAVVTADHGSAERWFYPDGAIDTGHTDSPVPFIIVPPEGLEAVPLSPAGSLPDAAPTVLEQLGLPRPEAMTGRSLLGGPIPGGPGPVIMIVLDGWGLGSDPAVDLIRGARTPVMDGLMKRLPMASLAAAGEAVGMPPGTVGNSEAGHLHLGAGRVVPSDRVRIDRALADGSFRENEAFLAAMRGARERRAALHLIGIVSFYSSHGSLAHLLALMDLAKREGVPDLVVHGFLGRRGERPESGAVYAATVEEHAARIGLGRLATVIGRFWSLDREGHWDRIARTWRLLVKGEGRPVTV